jgi:hypothetical protein
MQAITTVGLDIAKSVFQVHGIDAAGKVVRRPWLSLVELRKLLSVEKPWGRGRAELKGSAVQHTKAEAA